ncbi:general secretion pathway protein L [Pseudomonas sp. TE3786]
MSLITIFLPAAAAVAVDDSLVVNRVRAGVHDQPLLAEALAELDGPWRLVVPVEAITACAVQLPTQKARWLRQALPFAVEELLAEEVELFHLALGTPLADGRHRIYATRQSWLQGWLALCPATPPASIQIDADLLPEQGTQLCWVGERWLLGGQVATRLALAQEDWPALVAQCPLPVHAIAPPSQALPEGIETAQREEHPYLWLASQTGGCNLAQGDLAIREESQGLKRWRPVLGLVGLWLVLQWGFNLAQAWQLQHKSDAIAAANTALYRELFPQDSKLINLRHQLDEHLGQGAAGGKSRLLSLMELASTAVQADGGLVRVQQLDFSDIRGDLALQLQAPDFAALERLRQRLADAGLPVQLGSASREGNGVSARLVVGGQG